MTDKRLETKLVHAGRNREHTLGSVNSVIQHAFPLVFDTVEAKRQATHNRTNDALFYGRRGTLTYFSLQEAIRELKGGAGCVLFLCGVAAVANTTLVLVEQGDHVPMTNTVYEPSQDFYTKIPGKLGMFAGWFDPLVGADTVKYIQPNTKVVFLKSPGPVTMEVRDVTAITAAVRSVVPDAITVIDSTWAAGVLFKALDFGIDISIQVGTKYLIGHSDGTVGMAVSNVRCWDQLREDAYLMGQMLDAGTTHMTGRGLRTLSVRLRQHHESSLKVAEWLASYPQVACVNHPILPGSKEHELWRRDFTGSSGLFSFVLNKKPNNEEPAAYLDHFSLFSMIYFWGGFESLILANQPEHIAAICPQGEVDSSGTLIRLHIGLENVDDLIADLAAGFTRIE